MNSLKIWLIRKFIVLDGPSGKTSYYGIRVKFQVTGSPHVHSFIRVPNAPKLTWSTKTEYARWLDSTIPADVPNADKEPESYELVKASQIHCHWKICRKYRNEKCRFHFGKFFANRTIIAGPLPDDMSDQTKKIKKSKTNKQTKKQVP